MSLTVSTLEDLTLTITQEIDVRASVETTFDALLEQLGPSNQTLEGQPLSLVIEPRPGGRWFRDLGQDNGHLWGHVQAIKRPTLLEITGPLFMSAAVVSNVQYRLAAVGGGTLITFRHSAFGFVPDEYRTGIQRGWASMLERVRTQAESRTIAH